MNKGRVGLDAQEVHDFTIFCLHCAVHSNAVFIVSAGMSFDTNITQ